MVLHSDYLLDRLDFLLSKMQAQLLLSSNPDTRPLPPGWVEHFNPQRNVWYYINLSASQPRATFIHPSDERDELANAPALLSSSHSRSNSITSISIVDNNTPPNRTHTKSSSVSTGSTLSRRKTTAQQLYASSLGFGSNSTRSQVANTGSSTNSEPENSHKVSTLPIRSFTHPARRDSTSTASSACGPVFPVYRTSRDPRKFFDFTRPAQGTRSYRHDSSSSGSQTVIAPTPSISQCSSSNLPAVRTSGEEALPVQADGPPGNLSSTSHTTGAPYTSDTSRPLSSDVQAFYNPSVISKPPSAPSRPATLAGRHKSSISIPLGGGVSRSVSVQRGHSRPQPIHINHRPLDDYTATTEDETLKVAPNPNATPYLATSGVTEDSLLILPPHPTPTSARPTIDVGDVQNPEPSQVLNKIDKKVSRTGSISRLHITKKSSTVGDKLVLQQPRPVRPFIGLPAHLNIQVAGLDSTEDARYYTESFQGKAKERKSYGFSAIFEAMDRLTRRDSTIMVKENT